jgi:lactoylglutathione lyase
MNQPSIKNMSQVLLVSDLKRSLKYYARLGFHTDSWGHADLGGLVFILRQATDSADVRPTSKVSMVTGAHDYPHNSYDTYAYLFNGDQVDELFDQFKANGAVFAYEVITTGNPGEIHWRRFGLLDPDGYMITFGAMLVG